MRGKLLLILVFILSLSFVSSTETPITLKVNPNCQITLNVLNPETVQPYTVLYINSSEDGMAHASFSGDVGIVALSFVVRKEGKILQYVKSSDYGNFSTSNSIYIDTLQEPNETTTDANSTLLIANNTANVTTSQNVSGNASVNTGIALTGGAVSDTNATINSSFFTGFVTGITGINYIGILKVLGYIILGIAILIVVFFVIKKIISNRMFGARQLGSSQFTTVKYSEQNIGGAEKKIQRAQEEIRKAQEQINLIKNRKTRVMEAERKIEEDRKELERLRKGW